MVEMLRGVETSKAVLMSVLPVYFLILAGAVLRKLKILKREQDEPAFHLVFSVLYPCLILDKILGSDSVKDPVPVLWGVAVGFGMTALGMLLSGFAAAGFGFQKGSGKRTFALTSGVQNFGYTAIPVVAQVWGTAGGAMAMLFVHNLGVELAIWSVGVMMLSGESKIAWRRLVNGPVISVLIGLLLAVTGADSLLEHPAEGPANPVRTAMGWLGAGAFPIAILITGAMMIDLIGEEKPSLKVTLGGCLVRILALPALMLALAKWLPAPIALKQVMVIQAAMPSAMTPIMLAKIYGGRPGVAVQIVLATTLLSLFTLPFVIVWGKWWLGL